MHSSVFERGECGKAAASSGDCIVEKSGIATAATNRRAAMHRGNSSTSMRSILREGKYSSSKSLTSCSSSPCLSSMVSASQSLSNGVSGQGSKRGVNFATDIGNDALNEDDQKYEDDGELDLDDILKDEEGSPQEEGSLQSELSHMHWGLRSSDWSGWNEENNECHLDADFLKRHDDESAPQLKSLSTFGEKSMSAFSELSMDD